MASKEMLSPPAGGLGYLHDDESVIDRFASVRSQRGSFTGLADHVLTQSKGLAREVLLILDASILLRT